MPEMFVPTLKQIREGCEREQSQWDEKTWQDRRADKTYDRRPFTVPIVRCYIEPPETN